MGLHEESTANARLQGTATTKATGGKAAVVRRAVRQPTASGVRLKGKRRYGAIKGRR